MDHQVRNKIKPGLRVKIVLKKDQPTGILTEGIVQDILTNSAVHHRGIKVRLNDGQVGRVQQIIGGEMSPKSPVLEKQKTVVVIKKSTPEDKDKILEYAPIVYQECGKYVLTDEEETMIYLAKQGEEIVGLIQAKVEDKVQTNSESKAIISFVYVKKEYRKKGIGSGLVKKVRTELNKLGIDHIVISLLLDNKEALFFFANH